MCTRSMYLMNINYAPDVILNERMASAMNFNEGEIMNTADCYGGESQQKKTTTKNVTAASRISTVKNRGLQ